MRSHTSEHASIGHPDQFCNAGSAVRHDLLAAADPECRAGFETSASYRRVLVFGEYRTTSGVTEADLAEEVIRYLEQESRYLEQRYGIFPGGVINRKIENPTAQHPTAELFKRFPGAVLIENDMREQSFDIAKGVDRGEKKDQGAGDQGMMYGFATDETLELMPAAYMLARQLTQRLTLMSGNGEIDGLGPDGKSMVKVCYRDGKPEYVERVTVSWQHAYDMPLEDVRREITRKVILPVLGPYARDDLIVQINPAGDFNEGACNADGGTTGRKIVANSYGGMGLHGGGAFFGKDGSKPDNSGLLLGRWVAKNIVAAGLARKCDVKLAFSIGVPEADEFEIDTRGTNQVDENKILEVVREMVPLTMAGYIDKLDLRRPYQMHLLRNGILGKDAEKDTTYTWERLDLVPELRRAFGG